MDDGGNREPGTLRITPIVRLAFLVNPPKVSLRDPRLYAQLSATIPRPSQPLLGPRKR